jgi:hypothetical protein
VCVTQFQSKGIFDLYVDSPHRDIFENSASDHVDVLYVVEPSAPSDPAAHEASSNCNFDQFGLRRTTMKRFITLLSAGAVALMLSNSALAGTDSPVTAAQIEAATTPADHEAIAVAYDKEAARFDEMAAKHVSMAKAYRTAAATNKGIHAAPMKMHCDKLVETYKTAAEENRQMAAEHRKMKM